MSKADDAARRAAEQDLRNGGRVGSQRMRALVTYRIDGTVRNMIVEGGHLNIQMLKRCTIIQVSEKPGAPVTKVHLLRRVDHVELDR